MASTYLRPQRLLHRHPDSIRNSRRWTRLTALTLMAASSATLAQDARAAERVWDGSQSSDWFDARNWTPQFVPGVNDTAILRGGRITSLGGRDTSVDRLQFSGGTLSNGTLRAVSGASWSGGLLACTLFSNAQLEIAGGSDKPFEAGARLVNAGLATWSTPSDGAGRLLLNTNSRFENQSGATFSATTDGTVFAFRGSSGRGFIDNAGAFVKTGGAGTTRATAPTSILFSQAGTIRADVGALLFAATLNFDSAGAIGGPAPVQLAGTVNLNRLATIFGTVEMVGGTLNGDALGTFAGADANSRLRWSGGSMDGIVNIAPSLPIEIVGAGTKYLLEDGVLNNGGATTWSAPFEGAGRVLFKRRARWNNLAGSSFLLASDGTVFGYDDTSDESLRGIFNNSGLFAKVGGSGVNTFASTPNADFQNAGTLAVNTGVLSFNTRLDLNEGSSTSGVGLLRLSSGRANINSLVRLGNVFEVAGGTLNGASLGTLGASGGALRWLNGTIAGTLNVGAGLPFEISGLPDKTLAANASVNNAGAATWSTPSDGAGRILMLRETAFNIQAGGSFSANSSGTIFRYADTSENESSQGVVRNVGTFVLPGAGSRRVEGNIALQNAGSLVLNTGLLSLPRYSQSSTGVLSTVLAGDTGGSSLGVLAVAGRAALAGTLNVALSPGFFPASGASFVPLAYSTRDGAFASINGLDLGFGRGFDVALEANALRLTARARPIITSLSPTRGFTGDQVTILGQNLVQATSVTFPGIAPNTTVEAVLSTRSSAGIRFAVPRGARSGPITITTPSGTISTSPFIILPRLLNVSPRSALPGARVVLTGTGLSDGTAPVVRFGLAVATVVSVSPLGDRLEVIVPPSAFTGAVSVTTGSGVARSTFNFVVPPQITTILPLRAAPGSAISIVGRAFTGISSVSIGGVPAVFAVASSGVIRAFVPEAARSGRVIIVAASGRAQSLESFLVVPRILSISSSSGVAGSTISITGAGLLEVSRVRIGDISMPFTRVSATLIRAVVPSNALTGRISALGVGGEAFSAAVFQVLPSITTFSPSRGPVGTVVTVQGSGFGDVRVVTLAGRAVGFTRQGANSLSFVVPTGAASGPITLVTSAGSAITTVPFTVVSTPTS